MRGALAIIALSIGWLLKKKTIVYADRPGQLGNMLFLYAHLLAFCKSNHVRLINPGFDPYKAFFSIEQNDWAKDMVGQGWPWSNYEFSNRLSRVIRKCGLSLPGLKLFSIGFEKRIDMEHWERKDLANFTLLMGWLFRADDLVSEHRDDIRSCFQLRDEYQKELDGFFEQRISADKTLVGVHIRQGDYKTFEGGRYFYPTERYAELMSAKARMTNSENIQFLVCSDSPQEASAFKGLDVVLGPGTAILDMYALSRCEAIIGPPSTFTLWGQFMTGVSLETISTLDRMP